MTHYAPINESIRLGVTSGLSDEARSALAAFCRRNGFPHIYYEILDPLLARSKLILALATTERPWPPKGIGSLTIEGVGIAFIGGEGRASLTPVVCDLKHSTNIGLASALTKHLLEALHEQKASSVGYLVRQGDRALERALEQAGMTRSDLIAATEFGEYAEYAAPPQKVLDTLGLSRTRLGDILAAAFDGSDLDRLSTYHFTLTAGLAPYLVDVVRYSPLLPGLIDIVADLPPGGVPPGTAVPVFEIPGVEEE
jgi:hypothetical protein